MTMKRTRTLSEKPGLRLTNPEAIGTGEAPVWELVWTARTEGPDAPDPPVAATTPRRPCPGAPGDRVLVRPGTQRRGQTSRPLVGPVRQRGDHHANERRA